MESTHLCQHLQASRKEPYGSNPFVGPNPAPGNPSMSSKQCGQLLAVYCLNQQHDHRPGLRSVAIKAQYMITAALTVTITLILFLIYVFDHPFTGTSKVSAEPLKQVMEIVQKGWGQCLYSRTGVTWLSHTPCPKCGRALLKFGWE